VSVVDDDRAERAGWREVVVTADGVTVDTDAPAQSPSNLLRTYPPGAVQDRHSASIVVTSVDPGWAPSPHQEPAGGAPDPVVTAGPVGFLAGLISGERTGAAAVVVGLLVAFGLGIAHALAPGHGKTLMAAYLVASHGRARHAAGLGLAVAISHTVGVAALGVVTLAASRAFRPEIAYPYLSLASAGIVLAVGAGLVWRAGRTRPTAPHDHGHGHDHDHDHGHSLGHSHGHRPLPSLTWRSLATLGLAGGLVPSASAVVLLLGAVGLGRIELGLAMVALFGAGMATALVGAGLAVLGARRAGLRLLAGRRWGGRLVQVTPLVMGAVVALAGLVMTVDAIRRIAA
jgi:ABC-type nickel/cobalt efflux system permease component RcnA